MTLYERYGVRTIINASGTLTRLGGSRMHPEVLAAMSEAAASFVHIDELQSAAGKLIAEATGAEAGYVTTGAAAGLTLGIAACLAGFDVAKMDRLPDTSGMKHEVIIQRGHRNAYDHAIRAAGIKFVEVGYLGYPGQGGTWDWQIESAITENTVAIACPIQDTPGTLTLPEVTEIAHRHNLPVIVDAAAQLPPRSNLRRFIDEGADIVTFSGGKAIGGPQSSGILAGRADLIASVALQHQDMDVRRETWNMRHLLNGGKVNGVPHQGFGRSMKVGREEIVGLMVALERYMAGSDEADALRWTELCKIMAMHLEGIPAISFSIETPKHRPITRLAVQIDELKLGMTGYEVVNAMSSGTPSIAIDQSYAEFGKISIIPQNLSEEEAETVGRRLRDVLTRRQ